MIEPVVDSSKMNSSDDEGLAEGEADGDAPRPVSVKRDPVRLTGLLVVFGLLLIAVWYALSDRYAPSTTRGIVSANVIQIASRVSGRVTGVLVEDNEFVDAGDPIFHIDQRPFELAAEQARAKLAQATQTIAASSARLAASYAKVAQMQAQLEVVQAEALRMKKLRDRAVVSAARLQTAEGDLATAKANLDAAIAQAASDEQQIGVSGADNPQVKAARLAMELAEYDLFSTSVRAPARGVVTNLRMAAGQFAAAGSPVMTFIDARAAWITAELRENQLRGIDPGDRVSVLFDVLPGVPFSGKVESISWGIDAGRNEARGLPVNRPINQWFEPARRIPVRIVLDGDMVNDWPRQVKVGAKADVLIFSSSGWNPVSILAYGFHRIRGWLSVFY